LFARVFVVALRPSDLTVEGSAAPPGTQVQSAAFWQHDTTAPMKEIAPQKSAIDAVESEPRAVEIRRSRRRHLSYRDVSAEFSCASSGTLGIPVIARVAMTGSDPCDALRAPPKGATWIVDIGAVGSSPGSKGRAQLEA
jgi:hypothetical protein